MAKTRYIITSDTRIQGQPVERGATIDLDPNKADDLSTIGLLNHAGRIIEASDKDAVAKLNAEIAADEAKAKAAKGSKKPKATVPAEDEPPAE